MAKSKYKDIAPFGLRMPPELKKAIEEIAKARKQENKKWSANLEIIDRLWKSLEPERDLSSYTDGELIDELLRRYGPDRIFIKIGNEDLEGE